MSPYETGDIHVESEGTAASERDQRMVQLARSTYVGFNDHHLCEKLVEREGFSLSRETLRRLLRQNGLGSPRKRRAPAHRQRRLRCARLGELVQLDGSPHDWLEGRGQRLTALGMQDDATGKILAAQFFPSETTFGYLCLLRQLLRRHGVPLAFYGDHSGIFVRNDDDWTADEQLAGKRAPTQLGTLFTAITVASSYATTTTGRPTNNALENDSPPSSPAPWNNSLSPSSLPTVHRPKAASNACGASCRIVCAVNFAWLALRISTPPTPCCASSLPTTIDASPGQHVNPQPPGGKLPTVSTASAASCTNAPSATTTSCNGQDAASKSLNRPAALASPAPKYRSTRPSTAASRSTTARLACSSPTCQGGDTFMLPLG